MPIAPHDSAEGSTGLVTGVPGGGRSMPALRYAASTGVPPRYALTAAASAAVRAVAVEPSGSDTVVDGTGAAAGAAGGAAGGGVALSGCGCWRSGALAPCLLAPTPDRLGVNGGSGPASRRGD